MAQNFGHYYNTLSASTVSFLHRVKFRIAYTRRIPSHSPRLYECKERYPLRSSSCTLLSSPVCVAQCGCRSAAHVTQTRQIARLTPSLRSFKAALQASGSSYCLTLILAGQGLSTFQHEPTPFPRKLGTRAETLQPITRPPFYLWDTVLRVISHTWWRKVRVS
jgi:hypothetical protein